MIGDREYYIVDVFTAKRFGGNQLAVILDATGITDEEMVAITREFNFAETTFIFPGSDPLAPTVRIFTPGAEVPFAGHPTVGTAAVLFATGGLKEPATITLHERVGPVRVKVHQNGAAIRAQFTLERGSEIIEPAPSAAGLAGALSLPAGAVVDGFFATAGLGFCFAQIDSNAHVDGATLNHDAWEATLAKAWASQLFFFAGDTRPGGTLHARMFAPAFGIMEDAATGSASAALAGVLGARVPDRDGQFAWTIHQGVVMGRPSVIHASVEKHDGKVVRIEIGGDVVVFGTGRLV